MKKFNFLENLLRRESARSEKAVKASVPDSQPTVNRQSRLTSQQRHDSVTSARPAREWLKYAAMAVMIFSLNVGNAWGAVVSGTTYETKSSMPTGWSKNGSYQSGNYLKLISSSNYIQTDNFCQNGITSIVVKARTYGSPSTAQATITIEWVPKSGSTITLGTVAPTTTTLTNKTLSSFTNTPTANTEGSIKISCKGASSSKGSGVSEVTITYTSGSCGGTTYTVTYNNNSGSGTMTDAGSPYSSGATVKTLPNTFTRTDYIFTKWNTQAGGGGTNYAEGATFAISGNTTLYAQWVASSLRDDITCSTTGVTSSSYTAWSGKSASNTGHSSAVYAGTSAKGNSVIQLNSNGNYGLVTTTSGGTAKYIYVVWEGHTTAGRTIDIYGKNSAYTAVSDLYNSSTYGTKIGSIVCGTSTVLAINSSYKYIGIRSNNGVLYLTSVHVEWEPPTTYNVYLANNCTGIAQGSYSSDKGTYGTGTGTYSTCKKYSGITAGTSVTITATPTSGYQFDGWTNGGYSIILDDESNEITPSSTTSTTATFTMPSSDVVIWQCNFSETCDKSMTINKGTQTNCTFTLGTSGAGIASCDGVSTTVSITPTAGYGTPVVTESLGTATITGSGNSQTVTYAANTTGTSTINVSCSANTYTISLNQDLTPTSAGTTSITATYNSSSNLTSAITKPTKDGWTFAGYFTAKNGGGTQIIDANGNVIASAGGGSTYTDASKNWKYVGNITLYAKWTCTATWSVNGNTSVYAAQTITYNSSGCKVSSVPAPDPASYCGQSFAGWTTSAINRPQDSAPATLFKTVGNSPELKTVGNQTFYAVFADYTTD